MTEGSEPTEIGRASYAQRVEEIFQRWIDEGNASQRSPRLMRPLIAKAREGRTLLPLEIVRAANCEVQQAAELLSWLKALGSTRQGDGPAQTSVSKPPRRADVPTSDVGEERTAVASGSDPGVAFREPVSSGQGLVRDSFSATMPQTAQVAQKATPCAIGASVVGEGLKLTWPAYSGSRGQAVVYRVVSRAGFFAFKPEEAAHLAGLTGTEVVDSRPQTSGAIVCYQVWVYVGRDEADAVAAQPELWAQQKIVQPPQKVTVAAGEGTLTVVGRWQSLGEDPNTVVRVHRVPIEVAEYEDWDQPRYRISTNERNVGGFVDRDGQSGRRFRYYLLVQTLSDNVGLLSPVVQREAAFVDRLRQVTDLRVESRKTEQGASLEISWTPPPVGEVEIYWAQRQPVMGIDQHTLDVAELTDLRVGKPIGYPVSDSRDGRSIIGAVPWPHGWTSVYVTAITRLGDQIFPSASKNLLTDLVEIPSARLYQRVSHQNITLAWPERRGDKAQEFLFDWVKVYSCAPDTAPEELNEHTASIARITHDVYKKQGGVRLALGAEPKRVILIPGSTQSGQDKWGKPFVLDYPGLRIVSYTVSKSVQPLGTMRPITVKFRSNERLENPPPLLLVHHPERLPLSADDGDVYEMGVKDEPALSRNGRALVTELGPAWTESAWRAQVPRRGFVRIFAEGDPVKLTRLAVLDPAIARLHVGGW